MDKTVRNIKYCGKYLIDNAEEIVSNFGYIRDMAITCYVVDVNGPPFINLNVDFFPEQLIEMLDGDEN